ncbi:MAG: hypothetical protein ABIY71_07300 [Flavobacteriales bacterium]
MTKTLSIPKTPCPVQGLVPWMGAVWPIVYRSVHPVFGWLYTIHEKAADRSLCIHYNVSQEDIVKAMEAFATFKRGQYVKLDREGRRCIMGRKWNFESGTFIYKVEGAREGREWSVEQGELEKRILAVEEENG